MKAIAIHHYGSPEVLQYEERPEPTLEADQVLVRVRAASVNPVDWKVRQGMLQFLPIGSMPRVIGADLAGEVVQVGSGVSAYHPGDLVYGSLNPLTGGAYAEYAAVPESAIARKPRVVNFEEAAAIPIAGVTAVQALRDLGQLKPKQSVLINGASGGVGTFAVQIAKAMDARVTAVCREKNFTLVKDLGADYTLDYTKQDFAKQGIEYDVIFDAVGKRTFSDSRDALKPSGIYISTLPNPDVIFWSLVTAVLPGQKAKLVLGQVKSSDLIYLNNLIDQGKVQIVIDRTFPLAQAKAAHTYSEQEHTVGKLVLSVG